MDSCTLSLVDCCILWAVSVCWAGPAALLAWSMVCLGLPASSLPLSSTVSAHGIFVSLLQEVFGRGQDSALQNQKLRRMSGGLVPALLVAEFVSKGNAMVVRQVRGQAGKLMWSSGLGSHPSDGWRHPESRHS